MLSQSQNPKVDWSLIRSEFDAFLEAEGPSEDSAPLGLSAVLSEDGTPSAPVAKITAYTERLGANAAAAPHGQVFVNGKPFEFDDACLSSLFLSSHVRLMLVFFLGVEFPAPYANGSDAADAISSGTG